MELPSVALHQILLRVRDVDTLVACAQVNSMWMREAMCVPVMRTVMASQLGVLDLVVDDHLCHEYMIDDTHDSTMTTDEKDGELEAHLGPIVSIMRDIMKSIRHGQQAISVGGGSFSMTRSQTSESSYHYSKAIRDDCLFITAQRVSLCPGDSLASLRLFFVF